MRICNEQNCERKYKAKGLCAYHYNKKTGSKFMDRPDARTYHIWYSMRWRCRQKSGYYYKYYGSRGIKVCDRWEKFDNFKRDMGLQPEGQTLERKNNNLGYNPKNCRWATWKEQGRNRSNTRYITVDGVTKSLPEWVDELPESERKIRDWTRKGDKYFAKRVALLQG